MRYWDILGCLAPVVLRTFGGSVFIEGYETLFSKTFQKTGEMGTTKEPFDRKEDGGNDLPVHLTDLPVEDIVLM